MKKTIIIFVLLLILVSGCGKKEEKSNTSKDEYIICHLENMNKGVESITEVRANIKENKLKDAKAIITYETEEFANTMCDIFSKAEDSEGNLKCEDKTINIDNYHKSINNEKELTKEEFLTYMENQNFICEVK